MEWQRKITVHGQVTYNSIVAQYAASVTNSILWSRLELNPVMTLTEKEDSLKRGYYDPISAANIKSVEGAQMKALAAIKIERSLAAVSEIRAADSDQLTRWLKERFSVYGSTAVEGINAITFQAFVLEDGNTEWGYIYPEEGHFDSSEADRRKTDGYLNAIVRIDLLAIGNGM